MNAVLAFAIVMAVWTVSDWVAKKTQSLLSSLFVASIIFFVGFLTDIFPDDLLASSSLLGLGGVVVGFIIVHLGTLISIDEFKRQWKTLVVGISTVLGIGVLLWIAGFIFGGGRRQGAYDGVSQAMDYVVAGIGSLSGGTISVLIIQEAALGVGLTSVAIFPVLIAALQGLIGFPLTSIILRQEATRLKGEYRAGRLEAPAAAVSTAEAAPSKMPAFLSTTPGTLLVVGAVVLVSILINNLTSGILNTFVVALIFGIALRAFGIFKPGILNGIDAYGLMMLSIMILVFGPLATVEPADVAALAVPRHRHRALRGDRREAPRLHHSHVDRHRPHLAVRLPGHHDPVPGSGQGRGRDPGGGRGHRGRDPSQDDHRRLLDGDHHLRDRHRAHRGPHRKLTQVGTTGPRRRRVTVCTEGGKT